MGFFDLFKQPDINKGVEDYRANASAVLLDVREAQEYRQGHIPGSKNISVQELNRIAAVADDKNVPLYVYCYSGSHSRQAVGILQRMGYTNVKNIGGIAAYTGNLER